MIDTATCATSAERLDICCSFFFFFKQKTAYEIDCDWSSDVCSSDLLRSARWRHLAAFLSRQAGATEQIEGLKGTQPEGASRSEERRVGKECRSRWSPYH